MAETSDTAHYDPRAALDHLPDQGKWRKAYENIAAGATAGAAVEAGDAASLLFDSE